MPSFDVVSEVDDQEIDNAVNQTNKELGTRFDFRGSKFKVEYDREALKLKILADDDMKLRAIQQTLEQKLVKRSVDITCLDYGKEEQAGGNMLRQEVTIKNGIDREIAKKITQAIKESGLKVQAQIQDDEVRVTGKKIDDLQAVMARLRNQQFGQPLQFKNMRS